MNWICGTLSSGLLMLGWTTLLQAAPEKPLTLSPFGVVGGPTTKAGWKLFREAGIKWRVVQYNWAFAEPEPGKFSSYVDKQEMLVKQARDAGAKTLFYIGFSPLWANQGKIGSYVKKPGEKVTRHYPFDDDHRDAFKSFLRRTFRRFLPLGVDTYETWAESTGAMFQAWNTPWYPKFEAYQRYAGAMREVADEPEFKGKIWIIGDGEGFSSAYATEVGSEKYLKVAAAHVLARGGFDDAEAYIKASKNNDYLQRAPKGPYAGMSFKGLGKLHDAISLHAYWTEWPGLRNRIAVYPPEMPDPFRAEGANLNLAQYIETMSHRFGNRRVWITEIGYNSGKRDPRPLWVGLTKQAEYLVRYYVMALGTGRTDAIMWYCWQDNDNGSAEHGYGLLDKDGGIKPAYSAYQVMSQALEGKVIDQRIKNGPKEYVYCFKDRANPAERTYVLWQPGEGPARLTMDAKLIKGMNCYGLDGQPRKIEVEDESAVINVQAGEVVFVYAGPKQH